MKPGDKVEYRLITGSQKLFTGTIEMVRSDSVVVVREEKRRKLTFRGLREIRVVPQ